MRHGRSPSLSPTLSPSRVPSPVARARPLRLPHPPPPCRAIPRPPVTRARNRVIDENTLRLHAWPGLLRAAPPTHVRHVPHGGRGGSSARPRTHARVCSARHLIIITTTIASRRWRWRWQRRRRWWLARRGEAPFSGAWRRGGACIASLGVRRCAGRAMCVSPRLGGGGAGHGGGLGPV